MMHHKRGKVEANERWGWGGTPAARLTPDIIRPTHARYHPPDSRPTPAARLTPDTSRPTHARHQALVSRFPGRPAGRWPSRKSPYLTAPI